MLESIATMFSPVLAFRSFSFKSDLRTQRQSQQRKWKQKYERTINQIENEVEDILNNLDKPIETWILQKEKHLSCFHLHHCIFRLIQESSRLSLAQHKQHANRLSLHNIFVLISQYKILDAYLKSITSQELENLIDGICSLFLARPESGTIDQLSCVLHYVITHSQMFENDHLKSDYNVFKQLSSANIPSFIDVYAPIFSCESSNYCLDSAINSIPMMMELLRLICKYDTKKHGLQILAQMPQLQSFACQVLSVLKYQIDKILYFHQDFASEPFAGTNELFQKDDKNQLLGLNSQILLKLKHKSDQLRQSNDDTILVEGFISGKTLFGFAYGQLFYISYLLRMQKCVQQLVSHDSQLYKRVKVQSICLVKLMLVSAYRFQFNLSDSNLNILKEIVTMVVGEPDYQDEDIVGFEGACLIFENDIRSPSLQEFTQKLQKSKYNSTSKDFRIEEEVPVDCLEIKVQKSNECLYFLLQLIFNLKLEYLSVLHLILSRIPKPLLKKVQFLLIKNELLHFLFEELHAIHTNDKDLMRIYFETMALLLQSNSIAYEMIDESIREEMKESQKCRFVEELKSNFAYAKELLQIMVADCIIANQSKDHKECQFLPLVLKLLLYNCTPDMVETKSKHDVWIGYIHDVIIHEIRHQQQWIQTTHKKWFFAGKSVLVYEGEEEGDVVDDARSNQIYEWMTLIILLHIQYVMRKQEGERMGHQSRRQQGRQEDFLLGEFIMKYLSSILTEAIKWKHEDETALIQHLLSSYQQWELHSTHLILSTDHNEDFLAAKYGPHCNYLLLRKWNRRICNAIDLFLQSVISTHEFLPL